MAHFKANPAQDEDLIDFYRRDVIFQSTHKEFMMYPVLAITTRAIIAAAAAQAARASAPVYLPLA